MIDPSDQSAAVVPYWSLDLVKNVSEIKARVEAIPDLTRKLDILEQVVVKREDFQAVVQRTERLWDAYQRLRGIAWALGAGQAGLMLYVAAHVAHLVP